jgi:hypothetical protein
VTGVIKMQRLAIVQGAIPKMASKRTRAILHLIADRNSARIGEIHLTAFGGGVGRPAQNGCTYLSGEALFHTLQPPF